MANLRAIRKRISSVKSTRQITKAMKLVSGAKLRRATEAVTAARPYNTKLQQVLNGLMLRIGELTNPLFESRESIKKVVIVALSSDRGLCGSYNSNVNRKVDVLFEKHRDADIRLVTVGRRVRDFARRKNYVVAAEFGSVVPANYDALSRELGPKMVAEFLAHDADIIYLVYNKFKSAIFQVVLADTLLPLQADLPLTSTSSSSQNTTDFLYEPSQSAILAALLPQLIVNRIMQALLESNASEHGARMAAMDSATRNATDMIEKLTLEYNRARQAAITKELVEIVSGAEAL